MIAEYDTLGGEILVKQSTILRPKFIELPSEYRQQIANEENGGGTLKHLLEEKNGETFHYVKFKDYGFRYPDNYNPDEIYGILKFLVYL